MKILTIIYSIISYLIGVGALVGLILFIGDLFIPWTINKASPFSFGLSGFGALIANIALILAWGLQHSIMADPAFKKRWTKLVPPVIERSTYLLFVAVMTGVMIALWSPMPTVLWDFSDGPLGAILLTGYFSGWIIVLISTFLINHFHLFGLQQAFSAIKQTQSKEESFVTPFLYKLVRHPMMTGVLIALWCAPTLTVGRLVINVAMTVYIVLGVMHEEKALVADLGDEYEAYRKKKPMLIPGLPKG